MENPRTYYNKYWEFKNKQKDWKHEKWKRKLLSKIFRKNEFILDVGCGNGIASSDISSRNKVIGTDISKKALMKSSSKNIKPVLCDSNKKLPFKNNCFDTVLLLDILEHILYPKNLLSESKRILKHNGKLIISVPNTFNIVNRLYFALGISKDITDLSHRQEKLFSDHLHNFSFKILNKLINSKELKAIDKYNFFSKKITHQNLKFFSFLSKFIYYLKLYNVFPSLFSYSFFVIYKRDTNI